MRYWAISAVRSPLAMGITVVCQSCGSRRTVPAHLYDEKIRGKVVKIACRGCGVMISVDGTIPPPPLAEMPETPITEDLMSLLVPETAQLPSEHQSAEMLAKPREKQISHVDGPISEGRPTH